MTESTKPPTVFISYAWEDDVKPWVRTLAKQLRKDGVDAIFDEWVAVPGDQLPEFMEKSIRESDFVLVVCTPKYKDKSDKRKGGVGYEGNIITSEIFQKNNNRKFIAVLRKGDWEFALPSWAAGKLSMDLRGNPYNKKNYQELLRVLHNKWYSPPPVGRPPDFPDDEDDIEKPNPFAKFLTTLKDNLSKVFTIVKESLFKAMPVLRITGIVGIFIALFWAGSWGIPKFIALIPTQQATATATQSPIAKATSTNSPVSPTKTSIPNAAPTKTQPPPPTSLPTEITDAKGVVMRLVSEGDFIMGYDSGESEEVPVHTVYLDAYYMDKYEVTNLSYKLCVIAGICKPPVSSSSYTHSSYYDDLKYDEYPVIITDWNMAKMYCGWREARLPTEAEWEKAARGTQGYLYPWGSTFEEAKLGTFANSCDLNCPFAWKTKYVDDGYADTSPVGSYPAGVSPYGVWDLAGNLMEWVADWYNPNYYVNSPSIDPQGPSNGEEHVLRGGSWAETDAYEYAIRSSARMAMSRKPPAANFSIGFRCVRSAP
jgi:formylglycine-generating enzyme required for sulfatase activity